MIFCEEKKHDASGTGSPDAHAEGADDPDLHKSDEHPEGKTGTDGHADDGHGDHGHGDDGHGDDGHGGGDHSHDGHGPIDYLSTAHLFEHVQDAPSFHLPTGKWTVEDAHDGHVAIPQLYEGKEITPGMGPIQPMKLKVTKFMVIEVLVFVIALLLFGWLARRIKGGKPARGRLANLLEVFVVFIRNQVARPAIGESAGDRFVPFLMSLFIFILGCNLMGLVPSMGSPTGAWAVTSVMAILVFGVVCGVGIRKFGVVGFALAQVPQMDLPFGLGYVLKPMLFVIEMFGLVVKHFVLSVRLLANMIAGHIVLAVFLAFIGTTANTPLKYVVWPASGGAYVAILFLELFVAFLQAYIFTFLAALFIGAASHRH